MDRNVEGMVGGIVDGIVDGIVHGLVEEIVVNVVAQKFTHYDSDHDHTSIRTLECPPSPYAHAPAQSLSKGASPVPMAKTTAQPSPYA